MSEYNKKLLYWIMLKEDFFDEDALSWLEEQPNGEKYCLFYIKLCLKSLKSNGIIMRNVGEIFIPYDTPEKLAKLTKTKDVDTVIVAMELLTKIGLVKIMENGAIYIPGLENMIGAKTVGALKKEQQRMLGGQKADICPPKINIDIEKEIDISMSEKSDNEKTSNYIIVNKNLQDEFLRFYEAYPKERRNSKSNASNTYAQWITGKKVKILKSQKTIKLNHLQMYLALMQFKSEYENRTNVEKDGYQYLSNITTFLNNIYDYVEKTKSYYEKKMQSQYGDDWQNVRYNYEK